MVRRPSDIREKILSTVEEQLRRPGSAGVILEAVAREAGCAKGLVNYHFRTKSELVAAAAIRVLAIREARWNAALAAPDLEAAIRQSWDLITTEVSSGFWRAWTAIASSE